jgi:NAD kinase
MNYDQAIIIRSKTRLEQLIERFNTRAQAKFYMERSGMDFSIYENEHDIFYKALDELTQMVSVFRKYKVLDRSFLPNYIFANTDLIFVLGQDGLVANTAKYVKGQPIIAVNPDNRTYDGILLPFTMQTVNDIIQKIRKNNFSTISVTMAKLISVMGRLFSHLMTFSSDLDHTLRRDILFISINCMKARAQAEL